MGCGAIALLTPSRSVEDLGRVRLGDVLVRRYSPEGFPDHLVISPDKGDRGTVPEWNESVTGLQPSTSTPMRQIGVARVPCKWTLSV